MSVTIESLRQIGAAEMPKTDALSAITPEICVMVGLRMADVEKDHFMGAYHDSRRTAQAAINEFINQRSGESETDEGVLVENALSACSVDKTKPTFHFARLAASLALRQARIVGNILPTEEYEETFGQGSADALRYDYENAIQFLKERR